MFSSTLLDQPASGANCRLEQLQKGEAATITGFTSIMQYSNPISVRLRELGFIPGETVRVVAKAFPGNDPIAVRLGNTTFALRHDEAAMICVVRPQQIKA